MTTPSDNPSKNKWLLPVLIVLLIAGAGWFIFTRYISSKDVSGKLQDQLIALVNKKSGGLYQLSIGSLTIQGEEGTAVLRDLKLSVDSLVLNARIRQKIQPPTIYQFTLDKLELKQADILAFISNKTAKLNRIDISKGNLQIDRLMKGIEKKVTLDSSKKKFQKSLEENLDAIQIDTLHADLIDITYKNLKKQARTIKNIYLDLYQLEIDSTSLTDKDRIFLSRAMRLAIDSIRFPVSKDKYLLGAKQLIITVGDSSITSLQDFYLRPTEFSSLEKMAATMGEQTDVFGVRIKKLVIDNLDLPALMEDSAIHADFIMLQHPIIEVFNDKSLPPSTVNKVGKYPHQMIQKLPFNLDVPKILVEDGKVSYAEKNEAGDAVGKISFSNIKGTIGPIENSGPAQSGMKANFTAKFMEQTPVTVGFDFPVSKDGQFGVKANFADFDVKQLNEVALPLGNTRLKEGRITRLEFNVRGNNNSATGTTFLNYEGLKIEVMKKDAPGYQKNKLLSLIANTFVLHENNRPADKFQDAFTTSYQRVPTKSFFNLIWKTVFYGVKANTGVGEKGKDKERARIHN